MRGFLLKKYYLDCITEEGDIFLCYASHLRLGQLKIVHSSWLVSTGGEAAQNRQTFLRGSLPEVAEDNGLCHLSWNCFPLGIRGEWKGVLPSAGKQRLYATVAGQFADWHCLCPMADVQVWHGGRSCRGRGYAECLEMTLEPWSLPLNALHWGRMHTDGEDAYTWIFWVGDHPLSLLLKNHEIVSRMMPDDMDEEGSGFSIDERQFRFGRERVLRHGDISKTTLSRMPSMVKRILPEQIMHLKETKWGGSTVLEKDGEAIFGKSIHEVVYF